MPVTMPSDIIKLSGMKLKLRWRQNSSANESTCHNINKRDDQNFIGQNQATLFSIHRNLKTGYETLIETVGLLYIEILKTSMKLGMKLSLRLSDLKVCLVGFHILIETFQIQILQKCFCETARLTQIFKTIRISYNKTFLTAKHTLHTQWSTSQPLTCIVSPF